MMKKQIVVMTVFVLWFSLLCYSHGLSLKVEKSPPFVMITSMYHGGSVLTDAEVTVFLTDPQKEFQKGRIDKKGKFSFVPDRVGTWFFLVDDGMGHRKTIKIEIDTGFFAEKSKDNTPTSEANLADESRPETQKKKDIRLDAEKTGKPDNGKGRSEGTGGICAYCKILLGVVLIFAITLILYTWKKRGEN